MKKIIVAGAGHGGPDARKAPSDGFGMRLAAGVFPARAAAGQRERIEIEKEGAA